MNYQTIVDSVDVIEICIPVLALTSLQRLKHESCFICFTASLSGRIEGNYTLPLLMFLSYRTTESCQMVRTYANTQQFPNSSLLTKLNYLAMITPEFQIRSLFCLFCSCGCILYILYTSIQGVTITAKVLYTFKIIHISPCSLTTDSIPLAQECK